MKKFFTYERLLRALYDEEYRRHLLEAHNLISIITNIEREEKRNAREYKSNRDRVKLAAVDSQLNQGRTRV